MSWIKPSIILSTGILLAGLSSMAKSADAPPPRDSGAVWDNGPLPGRPAPGEAAAARRPQPPRDDEGGPPGPPEIRDIAGLEQPPPDGANPQRPLRPRPEDRERPRRPKGAEGPGENGPPPDGPQGDRPPGPPPRYPPRGRDDLESLKASDPALYKAIQEDRDLERQTRDQADQYRHAGKVEQAKIKEKLTEIVGKHFEVRQQLRNLEVKQLEQQLKVLREKIDQREKDRKDIVEKRVIELTASDDDEHF